MRRRNWLSTLFISSVAVLLFVQITVPAPSAKGGRGDGGGTSSQEAARDEKRFALVIGNAEYKHTDPLRNPVNDAVDVKKVLDDLGFVVLSGTNLGKKDMESLIRQFGDKLIRHGGTGVFYYAGHGLQVKGENYLVPVDADIPEEDEVSYAAVPLNFLVSKMESANNDFNIVILDACRNNPFARSWRGYRGTEQNRGLAIVSPPTGTMILYAAQPGRVASDGPGRNGLFTESLLKYIKQPGLEYEQLTQRVSLEVYTRSRRAQVPYKEGTKFRDFYFVNTRPDAETAQQARPLPSPDARQAANASYGDTLVTQNFSFKLLGCYLLSDSVGCDLAVTNLGPARSVGISAYVGSGTYLVSPNDVKIPALSVTTTGAVNYKHAICRMPSQGSCIYQLKFMRGLPQPTLFKTIQIDWTAGDNTYGRMPPVSFLNVELRQRTALDLGGRPSQQPELDLGGRPIRQPADEPVEPAASSTGALPPTGVAVTREGIRFELNGCALARGGEITCHLKLTNAGAGRRVYMSLGGSRDTFLIDSHAGEKRYSLDMKVIEEWGEKSMENYGAASLNLLSGQSRRISIRFSAGRFLLPSGVFLKEFKLSWSLGELNASVFNDQSPVRFKDIRLTRGQGAGGPVNR